MKKILLAAVVVLVSALPARATSFTIDSTNCNSSAGCYGLDWTLIVTSGSFGGTYGYRALLQVSDDPLVTGTPSVVISAVDFKASNSVSGAELYTVPSSTVLSKWDTRLNGLNSAGCTGSGAGFVCSQASILPSDPANFVASSTLQTWGWYFNTSDPLFTDLIGGHIGAKLTDISNPGKLLSASYEITSVPEPGTLALLCAGFAVAVFRKISIA